MLLLALKKPFPQLGLVHGISCPTSFQSNCGVTFDRVDSSMVVCTAALPGLFLARLMPHVPHACCV